MLTVSVIYAISNAFSCKFMPYFRRYSSSLLIRVGYVCISSVYGSVVRESCLYKSFEE